MKKRLLMLVLCAFSASLFPMNSKQLFEQAARYEAAVVHRYDAPKPLSMKKTEIKRAPSPTIYLIEPYEPTFFNEAERYCMIVTCGGINLAFDALEKLKNWKEKRD